MMQMLKDAVVAMDGMSKEELEKWRNHVRNNPYRGGGMLAGISEKVLAELDRRIGEYKNKTRGNGQNAEMVNKRSFK